MPITLKRHTVFCGTTNKGEFITDMTGSRRYWPVQIGAIDTDWTTANRSQIWAEAVVAYNNGEKWYLENEAAKELEAQSSDFRQYDPWHEVIEQWLIGNMRRSSTSEIMTQALSLEKYQMTRNNEMRVGDIMRQLGYDRVRRRIMGQRTYVWVKDKTDNVMPITKPSLVEKTEKGEA
jgi:predicted P-loop ATPase